MKLTEENYVKQAAKVMQVLCNKTDKRGKKVSPVTTSKIRNLLAMTADIYNEVVNQPVETLSAEIKGQINYMKIHFIYSAGREPKVRELLEEADILTHIDEIGDSRKQYILFSRYMEALVAYRKFYGEKDE